MRLCMCIWLQFVRNCIYMCVIAIRKEFQSSGFQMQRNVYMCIYMYIHIHVCEISIRDDLHIFLHNCNLWGIAIIWIPDVDFSHPPIKQRLTKKIWDSDQNSLAVVINYPQCPPPVDAQKMYQCIYMDMRKQYIHMLMHLYQCADSVLGYMYTNT